MPHNTDFMWSRRISLSLLPSLPGVAVRITNKSGDVEKVSARLREEAQLRAELSDTAAAVTWLKDGKELKAGQKYDLQTAEKKRVLKIRDVAAEDAGLYECICEGDRIVYQLSVKGMGPCGAAFGQGPVWFLRVYLYSTKQCFAEISQLAWVPEPGWLG